MSLGNYKSKPMTWKHWTAIVIVGLSLAALAGCAGTIPRESVELSIEAEHKIERERAEHLKTADEYEAVSLKYIYFYMWEKWFPDFIEDFSKLMNLDKEICKQDQIAKRNENLRDFVVDASTEYVKELSSHTLILANEMMDRRAKINKDADRAAQVQKSITDELKAYHKGKDFENALLETVVGEKNMRKLDKAEKGTNKLMKWGE